jgi:signal transduction histidine kinase
VRAAFQHCKEFSKQTGIKVDFFSAGLNGLRFDFDTEINLYRLIQESLRNISKHAQASQVTIRMVASYPSIILRIEDNGIGFDVKNRQQSAKIEKRMGLQSMQERVSLLNGKMELKSDAMRGTKFFIEVPFKTSTYEETTPFAVRPDDKISN